jgi:hypothetical protein
MVKQRRSASGAWLRTGHANASRATDMSRARAASVCRCCATQGFRGAFCVMFVPRSAAFCLCARFHIDEVLTIGAHQ